MGEMTPQCLSLIICDQVIEDKRTSKKSLIGTFNDIAAVKTPVRYPLMSLCLSLTNCLGRHEAVIEIFRDTDTGGERVLRVPGRLEGRNPLDVIDMVFELRGVPIPAFGSYSVEVRILPENERIAYRRFYVRQARQGNAPPGPPPQPPDAGPQA